MQFQIFFFSDSQNLENLEIELFESNGSSFWKL